MPSIFNIQKFSLHDGAGIRTVVFIKGCPLKCKWCSNPESQVFAPEIFRDPRLCAHCGLCEKVCPTGMRNCVGCGKCAQICPQGAITVQGRNMSIDDIVGVCCQDMPFYEESGGGVTLSGGEALTLGDDGVKLIDAIHKAGISVTIETSACAPEGVFNAITDKADSLLIDMKHWDRDRHIWGTGVPNDLILKNTKRAIADGKNALVRIPIIPDYNNSINDAIGFSMRLNEVGASRVQLLPFHQFGERKYEFLNRDYAYKNADAIDADDLTYFIDELRKRGFDAFI